MPKSPGKVHLSDFFFMALNSTMEAPTFTIKSPNTIYTKDIVTYHLHASE